MSAQQNKDFKQLEKMPCNTQVHLQMLTSSQAIRLRTHLIGIDSNRSILLAFEQTEETR